MNNLQESIPLFRTLELIPASAATSPQATIGDLCDYVGRDVGAATWRALQAECTRRYGATWHFDADANGDTWHVTRLHATYGG